MAVTIADVGGAACLVLAAVLVWLALDHWFVTMPRARREAANPRRAYTHLTDVPQMASGSVTDVTGNIVGLPALSAPATGQPCVAWELKLWRDDTSAYSDFESWTTVWSRQQIGDLQIAYDLRLERDLHHQESHPPGSLDHLPTPGTVTLPGDNITLDDTYSLPWGVRESVPLSAASGPQLAGLGVPDELSREVATTPHRYQLTEDRLTTGAFVHCFQPEPDGVLVLRTRSLESARLTASGCLVALPVVGSLVLLVLGLSLILD